jgi:molecular chaperone DnaJ
MAAKDLYEKDFYKTLGVDKKAGADEIKKKYRALARDLHPDKTKGDAAKEDKFKAVSEAYEILSDEKKRAEYDEARSLYERGGFRPPQGGARVLIFQTCSAAATRKIFSQTSLVAAVRRGPRKGQDLQTEATISFRESVFGTTLDLRLATDRGLAQNISARVPVGVHDGAKIRVKGKGAAGEAGPGDLFILLTVKPHPIFSRAGENLTLNLPVTFTEATLGADIKVPTLSGDDVTVRIAPGTSNGRTLRVKGRGIAKGSTTGDLLVTIQVQVPQRVNEKAEEALKVFAEATSEEDVRSDFVKKAKI